MKWNYNAFLYLEAYKIPDSEGPKIKTEWKKYMKFIPNLWWGSLGLEIGGNFVVATRTWSYTYVLLYLSGHHLDRTRLMDRVLLNSIPKNFLCRSMKVKGIEKQCKRQLIVIMTIKLQYKSNSWTVSTQRWST